MRVGPAKQCRNARKRLLRSSRQWRPTLHINLGEPRKTTLSWLDRHTHRSSMVWSKKKLNHYYHHYCCCFWPEIPPWNLICKSSKNSRCCQRESLNIQWMSYYFLQASRFTHPIFTSIPSSVVFFVFSGFQCQRSSLFVRWFLGVCVLCPVFALCV